MPAPPVEPTRTPREFIDRVVVGTLLELLTDAFLTHQGMPALAPPAGAKERAS